MNDIQIDAQWIPRDANKDDWSLNCDIFAQLDSRWGPHSVDRFASHYNAQLRRFNSGFLSPGCCAVDDLSQDWHGENNWLCPPVSIIVDVIRHTRACRAVGTLIVPEWPSAFFWPLLKPRPSRFASFVVDIVRLARRSDMIIPGPGQKVFYRGKLSVFFGCPKFSMLP